jgi:putative transcriptional regulator
MNPKHHPSEARLLEYATGSLPIGHRLVVQAHLGACPECAEKVELAEAVGGALLYSIPSVTMADDALQLALARIERPEPPGPLAIENPKGWILAPREVIVAARRSRRRVAPGVWIAPITRGPGKARTYLLGLRPGLRVPHHRHRGPEMICILRGAFLDGQVYGAGDFVESDESIRHSPMVTGREECVCLVSTEAPVVGADWFSRALLPLMGV